MIFVTTKDGVNKVMQIAAKYEVPAALIGKTIPEKEYRLFFNNDMVANVSPAILNNGVLYDLTEIEPDYIKEYSSKKCECKMDVVRAVEKFCADPNFASKSWIYTQYDHTVGARTSLAPGKSGAAGRRRCVRPHN